MSIEVPTVTLDELASAYSLLPDLVKIDVEGAEGLVLLGAKSCATNHGTRFLVEMHSPPELPMAANAAKVLGWCNELGYAAWYLARGSRLDTPNEIMLPRTEAMPGTCPRRALTVEGLIPEASTAGGTVVAFRGRFFPAQ
jgi:hypothetical protein